MGTNTSLSAGNAAHLFPSVEKNPRRRVTANNSKENRFFRLMWFNFAVHFNIRMLIKCGIFALNKMQTCFPDLVKSSQQRLSVFCGALPEKLVLLDILVKHTLFKRDTQLYILGRITCIVFYRKWKCSFPKWKGHTPSSSDTSASDERSFAFFCWHVYVV